jgi:hypothetical protein
MSYSFSCPNLERFLLSTVYITGRPSSFQLRAFIAVGHIDLPLLLSEFEADFFGIKNASYRFWHRLLISRVLWWQIVTSSNLGLMSELEGAYLIGTTYFRDLSLSRTARFARLCGM